VGIGTTTPSKSLHIANANDAVALLESTGSDATDDANIQLKTTNGTFTIQNDRSIGTSGALTVAGNTSNNIVVDHDSGDVGIGTSSPLQKLSIFDDNSDINMSNGPAGQFGIDGNGYGFAIALNSSGAQMYTNSSSRDLIFGVNETEVARVTDDGLTFNGDTAAANALDDYEEGTWTPDIKLVSASSTSSTYSTRSGEYTRIGNLCTVSCVIYNTAHSGTGTAYIHGLPFTHATSAESIGSAQMNTHSDSWSTNIGAINSIIQSGESTIHMRATYNTNTTGPLYIPLQNFTYLRITITYRTA
jgi:hypothetical protein